jgi:hypothetical protein
MRVPETLTLIGLICTIISFVLYEFRRASKLRARTTRIQDATALLAYEKLRLEVLKAVNENIAEIHLNRALETLQQTDREVGLSDLFPEPASRLVRKIGLATGGAYAAILIGVHGWQLVNSTEELSSAGLGIAIGVLMMLFFARIALCK